jgi:uncharacterized membrane protein
MIDIPESFINLPFFQLFITLAKVVLIIHTYKFKLQIDNILENYTFL